MNQLLMTVSSYKMVKYISLAIAVASFDQPLLTLASVGPQPKIITEKLIKTKRPQFK